MSHKKFWLVTFYRCSCNGWQLSGTAQGDHDAQRVDKEYATPWKAYRTIEMNIVPESTGSL